MRTRTRIIAVILLAATACTLWTYLLQPKSKALYRVVILPSLGGGWTWPDAINDRGQVVGSSTTADGARHLFLWDREGGMRDLGPVDGPAGINNEGQIAGTMRDPNGERRAFLCAPGGARRLLGTLGGTTSIAMALNNRGQVVGESWTAGELNHAFLWDEAQGMRDLSPPGTERSDAYAINDRGQVMIFSPGLRVSVWEPKEGAHARESKAAGAAFGDINNEGHAIFAVRLPSGNSRLMTSAPRSDWKPLREFEGSITDMKLNDANQVLFSAARPSRFPFLNRLFAPRWTRSYLLDPNRGAVLLDRLVARRSGESLIARDLNNAGDIVCALISGDNDRRYGVLLEPIPPRWRKRTPRQGTRVGEGHGMRRERYGFLSL